MVREPYIHGGGVDLKLCIFRSPNGNMVENSLQLTNLSDTLSLDVIFPEKSPQEKRKGSQNSPQCKLITKKRKWDDFNSASGSLLTNPERDDPNSKKLQVFSQITWLLQFLKQNKVESLEDFGKTIPELCKQLRNTLDLSQVKLSNLECRNLLKLAQRTFQLINSSPDLCRRKISDSIDRFFASLLDHLCEDKENAEVLLRRYALISSLIGCMESSDELVRRSLVEMLLLRIFSFTRRMWKVWMPTTITGRGVLVCPGNINVFFYLCQLLETVLTLFIWTAQSHDWLEERVFKFLYTLQKKAHLLFSEFPNLMCILYPSIIAVSRFSPN